MAWRGARTSVCDYLAVLAIANVTSIAYKCRIPHPTVTPWIEHAHRAMHSHEDANDVVYKYRAALHRPNARRPFRISRENLNDTVYKCHTPLHRPIVR